ncbi:hypothetical protein [Halobacillus seohaensis]|uniref:Uncharacterized protein n=1 Tax=Halobacillus seohaensis TaxID=447421 RepID=A0ABW2EKG0_9BACI
MNTATAKAPSTPPTLTDLYRRYKRSGVYDIDGLRDDVDLFIESTVNIHEDKETLDQLAGIYAFVHENLEREEWRTYTCEDWQALEHEWIEKSGYTEPDLMDDILTREELGIINEEQAHEEYESYRECEHVFCINVWKPSRKDKRYCCRDCKERQKEARKRYDQTGTFLPSTAYRDNRDHVDEQNYKTRETTFEPETVTEVFEPSKRQRETGRKRDRDRELTTGVTPVKAHERGDEHT